MPNTFPIYPSILAFDFARLAEQVAAVEAAGAAGLHFDVMDGHYVPNISFGPMVLQALRPHTKLPFFAHLMIYTPELYIEPTVKAGADRIYLHPEATPHIHRALGMVREAGVEVGVAINPGTPLNVLEPILGMVDGVLIMSVNPGFGGQAFIPAAIGRVAELRRLMLKLDVSPSIEVDGGVDYTTIGPLAAAGMTGAVVGTALFNEGDPAGTLRRMQGLAG
ncbi:MAG: ribulose-phosphate 3-epimerase [Armatimonadota bacterium]